MEAEEGAIESSSGPLAAAAARLSGRSRAIPTSRDFHFYNNFPDFKSPIRQVANKSEASLASLASSSSSALLPSKQPPPFPKEDLDDAHDWLVAMNDDLLERFSASMDEFRALREEEEGTGRNATPEEAEAGFQVVHGKKKRAVHAQQGDPKQDASSSLPSSSSVKMATKDMRATAARAKVPFHIPTITRPQDSYSIIVNNANQPFQHVWLDRSDDSTRPVHPLEKLSVEQFIDRNISETQPFKPPTLEDTPFKLVEDLKDLRELVAKLKSVAEFAVDLEHNHYRSFQGLTCLMQISTRSEDFVVDTLKLRIHIGAYFRELFKDPSKKKVMHGADRDIVWLQRDFGLYVCNLFDTGQASRVLRMERNSLEYLLHHLCGVTANKEYQSADWRLRPLPDEMIKYAREDTHYLLYIYDLMKFRLLKESEGKNDLLLEVYKRSNEICLQLYEKELLTDSSYLHIYGLQQNELNSKQLAVLASLYQWRDGIARAEDESTGYILPNKSLIDIAKEIPLTAAKLKRLVRKHPLVERHLNSVVAIIRNAVANSAAFETVADQLKKERLKTSTVDSTDVTGEDSQLTPGKMDVGADKGSTCDLSVGAAIAPAATSNVSVASVNSQNFTSETSLIGTAQSEEAKPEIISLSGVNSLFTSTDGTEPRGTATEKLSNGGQQLLPQAKATVQALKRPTAFGALLGNSTSGRKLNLLRESLSEQVESKKKVEKIKSSVVLPFHNFSGAEKHLTTSPEVVESLHPEAESVQHGDNDSTSSTQVEELIQLKDDTQLQEKSNEDGGCRHDPEEDLEMPESTSELSSGFEQCFQAINKRRSPPDIKAHQEPEFNFQLQSFDYTAARKNFTFGVPEDKTSKSSGESKAAKDSRGKGRSTAVSQPFEGESERSFQNPRRRQAFPPSGNRSTTYH